jgi:molybdenum cofactor synthesis domain-containing protein
MEAQKLLLQSVHVRGLPTEKVQVEQCLGRVLAEDVFSNVDIPSYDKTFIDGYAINSEETNTASTAKPAKFTVVGKLFPSDYSTNLHVKRGKAVYVACGAPIPKGASATVKVEETRLHDDVIEIVRQIEAGEGIIPLGDDVKKGDLLLKKGQLLRPQDLGLLASVKMTEVPLFAKPSIAILSGGDELLKQSEKDPASFANNYALVLAGLASELGADPRLRGIMPDYLNKVTEKIKDALETSDIVVTIGGSSVGLKDFVPDAVNSLGKPGVVVQGVLLRPGAVSGFGIVNDKPVIILPGHIGSCIAGFFLFVAPLISIYCGRQAEFSLPRLNATLNETVETGPQVRFLLVHVKRVSEHFIAEHVEGGSSALTTIVKANGYVMIAPHTKVAEGDEVTVFLFNKLEMAQI